MKQFRKNSRKAIAAFMSIWLSCIVFLFCCEALAKTSEKEFCPLAKLSPEHCDKGKSDKNLTLVSDERPQTLNCCGFLPAVFDKTRKIERHVSVLEPSAKPATITFRSSVAVHRIQIPVVYVSYLPARDRVFIKHRILRI